MPKTVTSYTMLISCPSDVSDFLDNIHSAVSSFNRGFGKQNSIAIETLHWSKDTYSNLSKGNSAQDEINRQLLADADMLLGILWTRFGSPTEKYGSGTEEEINIMRDAGKPVILYFLDKPISPSKIDPEQLKKIQSFKRNHQNDGLYRELENEAELALRLRDELELRFSEILNGENKTATDYTAHTSDEAALDRENAILWVDDHPEYNVFGREYFENNDIEVIPALSTQQALDILKTRTVSAIISDMGRKEGAQEGFVLLDKIREKGNRTPFLIFAASKSPKQREETLRRGGQGYTNDFSELFMMVSSILLGNPIRQSN